MASLRSTALVKTLSLTAARLTHVTSKLAAPMAVAVLSLMAVGQPAHAYIPLVDNQPITFNSCPISNPIHTQKWNGNIGSFNIECRVDGIDVVYTVTVPKGCENGGCGLVLDVHGMSMNANQQNAGTKLRQFGWVATDYGASTPYIVVQPNLTDIFDRNKLIDFSSLVGGAYDNEIGNLVYFTNHVIDVYNVDTNRTHMYGFSRGGLTVNAFYCQTGLSDMFASYGIGGMDFRCPADKPMMLIVGDDDSAAEGAIDAAEQVVKSMSGVSTTIIKNDPDYYNAKYVFTWAGLQRKGMHHHVRYQVGDFILETIRHSGSTLPLLGHCHASKDYNSWIVCHANMETGKKLIKFFIQNPR